MVNVSTVIGLKFKREEIMQEIESAKVELAKLSSNDRRILRRHLTRRITRIGTWQFIRDKKAEGSVAYVRVTRATSVFPHLEKHVRGKRSPVF